MLRFLLSSAVVLSMITVQSSEAEACLHSMKRNVDRDIQRLSRAEKALKNGRFKRAFNLARRSHSGAVDLGLRKGRKISRLRRSRRHTPLMVKNDLRAIRVMAVAALRTGGKTGLLANIVGSKEARAQNLSWAVDRLRDASKRRPHDSLLKTRLGEALATLPRHEKEAKDILESLAKEDLLADAHGYAAFAGGLRATGEREGAEEALKRCRAMARSKSICER